MPNHPRYCISIPIFNKDIVILVGQGGCQISGSSKVYRSAF